MRWLPALLLLSGSLHAQWINYPTAGIPRTKAGKPDLNAKIPRTADGKADFSGMWLPNAEVACPKMLVDDLGACAERVAPSPQATNIALGIPGGLPLQP